MCEWVSVCIHFSVVFVEGEFFVSLKDYIFVLVVFHFIGGRKISVCSFSLLRLLCMRLLHCLLTRTSAFVCIGLAANASRSIWFGRFCYVFVYIFGNVATAIDRNINWMTKSSFRRNRWIEGLNFSATTSSLLSRNSSIRIQIAILKTHPKSQFTGVIRNSNSNSARKCWSEMSVQIQKPHLGGSYSLVMQ